jgi:hypothetical protein
MNPKVSVCCSDLNFVPLKVEMEFSETCFDVLKLITLVLPRLTINC